MDTTQQINPSAPLTPARRRSFLRWVTTALGTIATCALGLPLVGYFLGRQKVRAVWVELGPLEDFPLEETRRIDFQNPLGQPWDGMTAFSGVFVRCQNRNEEDEPQFLVLSVHCAHLGCPVTWFQQSGLFMCPCHGGVYYADGSRASGPPPRGMFHCRWQVKDGRLLVQAPHYPTLDNTLDGSRDEAPVPSLSATDVRSA